MTTSRPAKADPEIAAALFGSDLAHAMNSAIATREGWKRIDVDPLTVVIEMRAQREGAEETYYLKLEGHWYGQYPPRVTFVIPKPEAGWPEAGAGSRWLPIIEQTGPGFLLHASYPFSGGVAPGQLICSSMNLDYYWTHTPEPDKAWVPGKSTLLWSLAVIQGELSGSGYRGASGAADL